MEVLRRRPWALILPLLAAGWGCSSEPPPTEGDFAAAKQNAVSSETPEMQAKLQERMQARQTQPAGQAQAQGQ